MFFFLSKTLSLLIQPLTWVLIPLALSMIPRFARWKKKLLVTSAVTLVFFTNPFLANLATKLWEYPPPASVTEPYEYAIVLGGMVNPLIKVNEQIQFNNNVERILSAIELYRQGKIKRIIISGGSGDLRNTDTSESPLLRDLAISLDVDAADIYIETKSQNTHQNALFVKEMLGDSLRSPVLLITSSSHMRRALGCFEKEKVQVVPYAVDYAAEPMTWHFMNILPDTEVLFSWGELIREWVGYVVYDIVGYI